MIAGHGHLDLGTIRIGELLDVTRDVGGAEEELWAIAGEERGVTPTLLLSQDVDLAGEVLVWGDGAGLAENLTTLDVLALDAAQQYAHIVACLTEVHGLTEHLDTGCRGGLGLLDADDLDGLVELELTALDAAGHDRATPRDGHDVLDGHEEGLLVITGRRGNVGVNRVHELDDGVDPLLLAVESAQRGAADDGGVIAGEVILGEEVTGLHLHEVDELLIVDHIALVQKDDDVGHADLTGEQNVLTGLSHRAIGGSDNEDRAVHLGGTRDHVLDVVRVARTVNVGIVALPSLVLDVGNRDGDAALTLLGGLVDVLEGGVVGLAALLLREDLRDGCGQRGLTMIDVTNRTDVYMRLATIKLLLGHCRPPYEPKPRPSYALSLIPNDAGTS